jgi:hypothetical protein
MKNAYISLILGLMRQVTKLLTLSYAFLFIIGCNKNTRIDFAAKNLAAAIDTNFTITGTADERQAELGTTIYQNGYVDEPQVLTLINGTWLCDYTKAATAEGGTGETIGISLSHDKGNTWQFITDLEPTTGPTAFYSISFVSSFGRVYVIYGYNNNNILFLNGTRIRTDAVGEMCYKYSDDNGITWSSRQVINMPVTQYDSINNWQGKYSMWWAVCKPILSADNQMYFSFTKVAQYPLTEGEGWVVNSPNINTETDISKIMWNFLPSGSIGIRSPTIGLVQEEHNIVQLSDGSFCCVFRTSNGYPAVCYSKDNCQTWSVPAPMYFNDGSLIRNPRACARIVKLLNGKYLLWFENNSLNPSQGNYNRNPAWVSGGTESNGVINWSQPEVLLYSQDTTKGFSYPDIFRDGSNYYLTETQKTIARLHAISSDLLNSLWSQGSINTHSTQNMIAALSAGQIKSGNSSTLSGNLTTGITMNLSLNVTSFTNSGQTILSFLAADRTDTLIKVRASSQRTIEVDVYNAGQLLTTFYCDNNLIKLNSPLFISISIDPNSRVLTAMINGVLCDGYNNNNRISGWVIVPVSFNFSALSNYMYISGFNGSLNSLQIYNRPMTTGQMLSEYLSL